MKIKMAMAVNKQVFTIFITPVACCSAGVVSAGKVKEFFI
jgi:hypothetical protein